MQATADRLEVDDIFILRRVSETQYANLDGVGRGAGWAGNVVVDPAVEPLLSQAAGTPGVARPTGTGGRVFGPYWKADAAAVGVADYVVIFGGSDISGIGDELLMDAAGDIAWRVGEVAIEKRLADDLEVTTAALAIATIQAQGIDDLLGALAEAAMTALSCEFGAIVVRRPEPRLIMAPSSWAPDASSDLVLGSLLQILVHHDHQALHVTQDLREDPASRSPLGFDEGLVSRCVVPIEADEFSGAVVVAHTLSAPRGFTGLCQRVASTIGEQAVARIIATNHVRV